MPRTLHSLRKLNASKLLCAFLLAFQFIFLNVILPGHARGAITLSGKSSIESLGDLGCPFCAQPHVPRKSPTRRDQSDCAICHLAVRITFELPFDFRLTDLGLLRIAPPCAARVPLLATIVSLPLCRGPPAFLPA